VQAQFIYNRLHLLMLLQEGQSLYVLGKNINSCTFDPLPESVPIQLRQMVAAMLQPNPQQRPSVHQLVQACEACVAAVNRR
jgi:hypothetical protein